MTPAQMRIAADMCEARKFSVNGDTTPDEMEAAAFLFEDASRRSSQERVGSHVMTLSNIEAVSDERLREIADWAASEQAEWQLHDMPRRAPDYADVVALVTQELSRRAANSTGGRVEVKADPYSGDRKTFVIPDGYEAVRDENGRATGEVRPISLSGEAEPVFISRAFDPMTAHLFQSPHPSPAVTAEVTAYIQAFEDQMNKMPTGNPYEDCRKLRIVGTKLLCALKGKE